MPMF